MATTPTIRLPDLPDNWFEGVTKVAAPDSAPSPAPRILEGLPSASEWTPADSSLNVFMSPDDIKTIDFSGTAPPEPPPWSGGPDHGAPQQADPRLPQAGGESFYTGLTPYQPDPAASRMFRPGLNEHGYVPQAGDAGQLARVIYAEGSNTPQDMDALGWAVVNRVGDREFGPTLDAVIHKKNAFQSVQENSKQWQDSAEPETLTGPNAKAWRRALDTAQGILGGAVPDPVDGASYFFNKRNYNGEPGNAPGDYERMLGNDLIAPVYPPRATGTANYFFNRNPYPPKR